MDHKVSIVVPVYGVEKYIAECIESLSGQTYENLEIILVDDVMTTGATASECVNELRKCGAAEVIVLTLARTENKKSKK